MKKCYIPVFLLLTCQLLGQTSDPILDSLARALGRQRPARAQAERLEDMLWYLFKKVDLPYEPYAQQLDSLNKCCIAGKTGDRKLEARLDATTDFFQGMVLLHENPEAAVAPFEEAAKKFQSLGDSAKTATTLSSLCLVTSLTGDSLLYGKYREPALRLIPHIPDTFLMAMAYSFVNTGAFAFGMMTEAVAVEFMLLDLIDQYPVPLMLEGKARTLGNIAVVYQTLEDYENARKYAEKSLEVALENGQYPDLFRATLADVYLATNEYRKAADLYEAVRENMDENTPPSVLAGITYSLASCYRHLGEVQKAYELALEGVERIPLSVHVIFGGGALFELANCELELGMLPQAQQHALAAYQAFSEARHQTGSAETAGFLTRIFEKQGDYRRAFQYSELRYQHQRLAERQQHVRQLALAEYSREVTAEKLEREAEIQAQLSRQRNIRYALLAGLLVAVLILFLLYNRYQFKQKTAEQLAAKNREVEAARLRAERSEAFKSRFLANMSHEIRTPLHGISGYTELLLETSLTEKQRRYLSAVRHSNERLTEVVNDILDISKLEAGEVHLRQVPFSPARILADVQESLTPRAENKGISLDAHIGGGVPEAVVGDPTRLYQILMNLAGNAVKFTEEGSVSVTIDKVEGSPTDDAAQLLFKVADTGIGIPSEKLDTIFDSFQQADGDTTARFGGTGLGLTIARELVQLYGSDIQVQSRTSPSGDRGAGSTFSFVLTLPIADAVGLEQNQGEAGSLYFTQPLKILLADDNAFNREIATEALRRHFENVEIVEATNGREVIEILTHPSSPHPSSLILMDMQMPDMNGVAATRHIRHQFPEGERDIPIIALTASATPEEIGEALAAGMNHHLPKPFKSHELASAIAQTLSLFPTQQEQSAPQTSGESHTLNPSNGRFDLRFLRDFCGGDEEQVQYFLQKFNSQCPQEMEKLKTALERQYRQAVYRAAHSLKPQLEFVGLREAATLATTLEQQAQGETPWADLQQTFGQLEKALEGIIQAVD